MLNTTLDEAILVAFKALKLNKVRSFLTMLGVIIGVTSVILLTSIGSGLQAYIKKQFEEVGSNLIFIMPGKMNFKDSREGSIPYGGTEGLKTEDLEYLEKRSKYIKAYLPVVSRQSTVSYGRKSYGTFIIGTNENYERIRKSPIEKGKFFTKSQAISGRKVAVAGTTVIEELFGNIDPINKKIRIGSVSYTIIGILESKGGGLGSDQDDQLIIPVEAFERQFNPNGLSYIYAEVNNTDQMDLAISDIETVLKRVKDEDDFSVVDQTELLSTFNQILGVLTVALGGIAAISLFVGGIGIMNIMLVSVTERTKEIGLRKAIGATPKAVLQQFLIEALIISFGGGIIGIILGQLGSLALNQFFPTEVTPWSVILAFGVSGLVGVVFGIAPAYKAAKLNPIDALRYE